MDKLTGAYVVSWDFTNGKDKGILLVGNKHDGILEVVNAFQGEAAYELYMKLTTQKKE